MLSGGTHFTATVADGFVVISQVTADETVDASEVAVTFNALLVALATDTGVPIGNDKLNRTILLAFSRSVSSAM